MKKNFFVLLLLLGTESIFCVPRTKSWLTNKRILFVPSIFPSVCSQVLTTLKMLINLENDVYVYPTRCLRKKLKEKYKKIYQDEGLSELFNKIYLSCKNSKKCKHGVSCQVIDLLRSGFFDLVFCNVGDSGYKMANLKKKENLDFLLAVKLVGKDLTEDPKRKRKLINGFRDCIDLFLPVCKVFKSILISYGIDDNKIKVLFSATKTDLFFPPQDKNNNRKNISVIGVGRLIEKKGFFDAIRAMKMVIKKYPFIKYYIVGDGFLKKKLTELIQDLNCNDNIFLVGKKSLSDVAKMLREMDIFLLTSHIAESGDSEGIPRTIKEAMATKLPIVATDHSGIGEVVVNNKTGLLVKEHDIDGTAKAVIRLIKKRSLRRKMGRNGHKVIKKIHSLEATQKALEKILN